MREKPHADSAKPASSATSGIIMCVCVSVPRQAISSSGAWRPALSPHHWRAAFISAMDATSMKKPEAMRALSGSPSQPDSSQENPAATQ